MYGYYCKECKKKGKKIELHYKQVQKMRIKQMYNNKLKYHAWCPKCKQYFWLNE
jgi:hypothetical protein